MLPRLKVVDLNPHLSCILCGGYFIDATTITECLHSFCRACIVRYLETSEYCPVCEVQVHKSKPLRSDKILQDIVYKLVPGLFHNEMKRRRELYASQPPEALKESRDAEDRGECLDEKFIYAPNEIFSISIEYGTETEGKESVPEDDNAPRRRFLRCPAALTVGHLKKFVRVKYGIPNSYEIDLKYDKESLCDDYTLMDVAYIFLWKRKGPMRFSYKIVERPPKKLKSESMFVDDVVDTKHSEEPETKEETEALEVECTSSSAQSEKVPETQPSACSTEKEATPLPAATESTTEEPPAVEPCPADVPTKTVDVDNATAEDKKKNEVVEESSIAEPAKSSVAIEPAKSSIAETTTVKSDPIEESVPVPACIKNNNKESKHLPFKFPPASLGKSPPPPHTESKPAVMTVAPFIKPSSTLPTTSSTQSTHGLYTGISIKKSPPNTLPPFKISAHLLPPRVPPLKLSPPRFSKIETCLRELSSSKKSSASKKSRSSRGSSDKLELKVAQLKSSASSFKYVAPLVISVPPEAKLDLHHHHHHRKDFGFLQPLPKKPEGVVPPPPPAKIPPVEIPRLKETPIPSPPVVPRATFTPPPPPPPPTPPASSVPPPVPELKSPSPPREEEKMDLDLFEGPLVIAEPDTPPKEDSNSSSGGGKVCEEAKEATTTTKPPPEDSEDEEIDVVDDCEADSGRGSDVSSRTEARSLCGDDDLGSPDSLPPKTPDSLPPKTPDSLPPKTPDSLQPAASLQTNRIVTDPKANGMVAKSNGDCGGALDLSTCSRKRGHDGDGPVHRAKQVANPAVLDKTRQTTTPCVSPDHSPFKVLPVVDMVVPHHPFYSGGKQGGGKQQQHESGGGRGSFKCRGSNLAVINPNPNGSPKLVIRNLGPRPGHERFHHHHHHHNHHHQRM